MRYTKLAGLLTAMTLMGFTIGCDTADTPTIGATETAVDDYETMDMDKAYGGLTFTDEPSGFGDDYFVVVEAADNAVDAEDPFTHDPDIEGLRAQHLGQAEPDSNGAPRIIALRINWGRLDGAIEDIVEDFDVLDWSGSLSLDRGALVVRRLLLFERPHDHLVRPRPDRLNASWVSHTGPHHDGLLLEIIEPAEDDADELVPNMLRFATDLFEIAFDVADLGGLDLTEMVDDLGNGIRFEGLVLGETDLCPEGFLDGIWVDRPDVDGGFFKGRWMDDWGLVHGHLRGRFGTDDDGERVFHGKYIGMHGHVRGLLTGTWLPGEQTGVGGFSGHWAGAGGEVEGLLGGGYLHLADRPGGFFSGRWATLCAEEAVETLR